ncbi:hypothetical protein F5050DRAFT_1577417 [Lentinula boryana]|uniref:FAD/NAD(P)-binding domain-containing protein n=1 Tax=Lentinula boryana TaxID=40481 RepID=A0ABQ8Q4I7_9AGAR|nr:hypothetical protein F5050DRAFT_1577417 [Lentinula boryana]
MSEQQPQPHIVIVGAGISGIASAIALKRQLGFTNFTICEKTTSIGSTWRTSTYPGCASDIPCHLYSLSSDLNPDWSSHFATQPQILAYLQSLYRKHGLQRHTKFQTSVHEAEWNEERQVWRVTLRNEKMGKIMEEVIDACFLIYGLGGFMAPKYPKGISVEDFGRFKGDVWHSAEWRHDVDLKNKTVAVVGNGCSGAKIVPTLLLDTTTIVINFIRSPQWLVPMNQFQYSSLTKWIFRHVPLVMRWYRNAIFARADIEFLVFRKKNKRLREVAVKGLTSYIKSVAPASLWGKLIPDYPVGAKQIIVDPKYLESLGRPNVELQTEPIESLVGNGIRLKDGKIVEVDAVVFATGYSLEPTNLRIHGLNRTTIREYFDEHGGPTAYLGGNFPGFPNLSYIIGTPGHASLLFNMEAQIQLAIQLAAPIIQNFKSHRRTGVHSLTIKEDVTDSYNTWLQSRIASSVWPDCGESYYYVDGTSRTKNIAMFPGPAMLFWWFARKPRWGEWVVFGEGGRRLNGFELWFGHGIADRDVVMGAKILGALTMVWVSWMVLVLKDPRMST